MTRGLRYGATLALATVLATTVLAGCGSDDSSDEPSAAEASASSAEAARVAAGEKWAEETPAAQMYRTGLRQLRSAGSVRFRLKAVDDDDGESYRVDLTVVDGKNCFGSLQFGKAPQLDLTVVDGKDYLRTTPAGWREFVQMSDPTTSDDQGNAIGRLYDGKWVTTGRLADFCTVLDQIGLDGATTRSKSGLVDVEGTRGARVKIVLEGEPGTAVLDLDEPHRLLQIRSDGGTAVFSDYDQATEAPVPPRKDQLDIRSLGSS